MNNQQDYAQHHEDHIEPRNAEVESGVNSLRDNGHYRNVFAQDVVDEMPSHDGYVNAVLLVATINPMSPEGKQAMDGMSDIYDWAARRVVERAMNRQEKV